MLMLTASGIPTSWQLNKPSLLNSCYMGLGWDLIQQIAVGMDQ